MRQPGTAAHFTLPRGLSNELSQVGLAGKEFFFEKNGLSFSDWRERKGLIWQNRR